MIDPGTLERAGAWATGIVSFFGALWGIWVKWGRPTKHAITSHFAKIDNLCTVVDRELNTNGGASLKDTVCRIDLRVAALEGKHRAAMSHLPCPIWEADAQGQCVWVNRAFVKTFAYGLDAMQAKGWLSMVHPACVAEVERQWEAAVKDHRAVGLRFLAVTGLGKEFAVYAEALPINDPTGRCIGYLGTIQTASEDHQV